MNIIDQLGDKAKQKPGIPCVESRQLATELSNGQETFTYEELSAVIGSDVRGLARSYLLTAREIVLREKGFVFRPMRKVGLRRLTDAEVAALEDRFTHVRRTHKKTLRELGTVDLAAVPEAARMACVGKMALAHLTVHTHQPAQMKRLENFADSRKLDLAKTLDAFRGVETDDKGGAA